MPSRGECTDEEIRVGKAGRPARFLRVGRGRPMVLLHADGENRQDWRWVLAGLASRYEVFAPDLPGFDGTGCPADCSPGFFEEFLRDFVDALDLDPAVVVGNSLGGVAALRLALDSPGRVSELCLVGAAGLGAEVSLALRQLTLPAVGEAAVGWGRTPVGAAQRALLRVPLLFAHPTQVPPGWLAEQYRLAMLPGFLATTLAALRGLVGPAGQRHVLIDDLPRLAVPTLLLWGDRDRVVPVAHARTAVQRVPHADLAVLPATGHLPHVEQPEQFVAAVLAFLSARGPR